MSSQPTEAEEGRDEDPEGHQDRKHEAAVVGGVGVGSPGARLDPVLIGLPFGVGTIFIFFLLFLLLLFLQAWVRLQLWHL